MLGQRFKEERLRLGLTQPAMGEIVGTKKRTIIEWEKGASSPTAAQLELFAEFGMDITYVVTGKKNQADLPPSLAADEQMLVDAYRTLPMAQRKKMLASLLTGELESDESEQGNSVTVNASNGHAAGRDMFIKKKG